MGAHGFSCCSLERRRSTACWHVPCTRNRLWEPVSTRSPINYCSHPRLLLLAMGEKIPWWLTIMVLSRDVLMLIVAAVILLIQGYRPFPPSLLGKATTFFEIGLVFFAVYHASYPNENVAVFNHYLEYLVAALVTISGFHYSFVVARRLHGS